MTPIHPTNIVEATADVRGLWGPQNTEGVPMPGGRAEPGCLQFITSSKRSPGNLLATHPCVSITDRDSLLIQE